ncbi:MAG TPA: hypothetical protein VIS74_02905 [Chthoniobacterales bacterium]
MDNEKARLILSAYRPGGSDAGDPVFAEALEQARRDPELGAWLAQQRAFDSRMKAGLQSIPIPRNLKASLLVSGKVSDFPASRSFSKTFPWLAVAAGLVALVWLTFFLLSPPSPRVSFARVDAQLRSLADAHQHAFETPMHDLQKIRAWLVDHGAPHDFTLPDALAALPGLGCEVISVEGIKVSILCFPRENGRVAHLYVINRAQLLDPPSNPEPAFQQKGAYAQAAWSDGKQTYLLVERGDYEAIKGLL